MMRSCHTPNSNFVSAMMIPRFGGKLAAALVDQARQLLQLDRMIVTDDSVFMRSIVMFSS